jgi:hypothetical protein
VLALARIRSCEAVDIRIKPRRKKFRMASDPFAIVRVKCVKPAANKNEWVGLLTALTAAEQASNDMTLRLRPGS